MLTLDDLTEIRSKYADAYAAEVKSFDLKGRDFLWGKKAQLMGVINLSAQSWYRESVCLNADAAIQRGRVLAAQGAALIDVGAESTLEQAAIVGSELQKSALLPVVKTLSAEGVLVSVETYHLPVAEACFQAGAAVLNLTGNLDDDELYRCAAAHNAGVILCYLQGRTVREVGEFAFADDIVSEMYEYFARKIERAERNGVKRIFVDPGLGFYYKNLQDSGLRIRHQMQVFLQTFRLRKLGYPTCHALPHAFEFFQEEVRCAEPYFAVLALLGKTDLLRTHELPRTRAVAETLGLY